MTPLYHFDGLILNPAHIISYVVMGTGESNRPTDLLGALRLSDGSRPDVHNDKTGRLLHNWLISQAITPPEKADAIQEAR